MKNKSFLIILLLTSSIMNSQTISNSIIGSIGGHQEQSAFGTIHWTIGEMVVKSIGKYQEHHQLSQGFHQTYPDFLIINSTKFVEKIKIEVFPNPTSGQLSFKFESIENIHGVITNQIGQQINVFKPNNPNYNMDISSFRNGMYFISIFEQSKLIQTIKILKIN